MIKRHIHYYIPKKYLLRSPDFSNPMVDVLDITAHIEDIVKAYANSTPPPTPVLPYSFSNGIQSVNNGISIDVGLGGVLTRSTDIDGDFFNLNLYNLQSLSFNVSNFIGITGNANANISLADVEMFTSVFYQENKNDYSIAAGETPSNGESKGRLSLSNIDSKPIALWKFASMETFDPIVSMELTDSYEVIDNGTPVGTVLSGLFRSYKDTPYSVVRNEAVFDVGNVDVPGALMLFNNAYGDDFSKRGEVFIDLELLSLKKEDNYSNGTKNISSVEISSNEVNISSRQLISNNVTIKENNEYGTNLKVKHDGYIGIYKSYDSISYAYRLPRPLNSDNYNSVEISYGNTSDRVYPTLDYKDMFRDSNYGFFSDKIIKSEVTKMLVVKSGEMFSNDAHMIIPNSTDDLFIKEVILHYEYESATPNTIYVNMKNGMHGSTAIDKQHKLLYDPVTLVGVKKWRSAIFSSDSLTSQSTNAINSVQVAGTTLNKTNDLLIINIETESNTDAILNAYVTIKYEVLQTKF